jgi:hypothetical protein
VVRPERSEPLILVALHGLARAAVMPRMSTKSREVIFGSRIAGAKIRADEARKRAQQAVRDADRAEAKAWSIRMGGLRRPSATVADDRAMPQRWVTAGSKSSAAGATPRPASRSNTSAGRVICRSGSSRRR